jgi:hypothetical protein
MHHHGQSCNSMGSLISASPPPKPVRPTPAVLAPYPYPTEWQPWIRRGAWRVFSNRLRIYTLHADCDSWVPRAPASACSLVRRGERKRGKGECRYTTCFLGRRIQSLLYWWIVCYAVEKTRYGAACGVCWSWSKVKQLYTQARCFGLTQCFKHWMNPTHKHYSLHPILLFVLTLYFFPYSNIQIDENKYKHIENTYIKYCMNLIKTLKQTLFWDGWSTS